MARGDYLREVFGLDGLTAIVDWWNGNAGHFLLRCTRWSRGSRPWSWGEMTLNTDKNGVGLIPRPRQVRAEYFPCNADRARGS